MLVYELDAVLKSFMKMLPHPLLNESVLEHVYRPSTPCTYVAVVFPRYLKPVSC